MADPLDYTDKYNTALGTAEPQFQGWLSANSKAHGRDLSHDLYDYDLRGQFKGSNGAMIEPGHGTDLYKKPNHPTFSNESIYHGVDGHEGGAWAEQNGQHSYTPSRTNLEMRSPAELQQYFREVEPDIKLNLSSQNGGSMSGVSDSVRDALVRAINQQALQASPVQGGAAGMPTPGAPSPPNLSGGQDPAAVAAAQGFVNDNGAQRIFERRDPAMGAPQGLIGDPSSVVRPSEAPQSFDMVPGNGAAEFAQRQAGSEDPRAALAKLLMGGLMRGGAPMPPVRPNASLMGARG